MMGRAHPPSGLQSGRRIADGPLRSLLFCPGNNERRMHKALAAGADAVILDLEDSVHPDAKDAARALFVGVLAGDRPVPVAVRVNAEDTAWHLADLAAILPARPDGVMLRECEALAALRRLSDRLDALEAAFGLPQGSVAILPLVTETATALADMAYGGVTPRLAALCFAAEDLAADLGVEARDRAAMAPLLLDVRHRVILAAAGAGVLCWPSTPPFPTLGGLTTLPTRPEARPRRDMRASAASTPTRSRWFIRPSAPVLRRSPGRAQQSRRSTPRATGVAVVGGKMVDRAHLKLAMRYLGVADAEGRAE